MPTEKKKILEFKQYTKSDKMSYVIYAEIESLIRKKGGCVTNPQKYSTTKTGEHIPWGYLMWTISVFDHIENKHTLYRGKDCVKDCKIVLWFFKRTYKKYNCFSKEKNVTVNKRRINNISIHRGMLYLRKKNPKIVCWRYSISKSQRSISLYR